MSLTSVANVSEATSVMTLDFDVLINVMPFMHGSSLLPLMQSCRTLHAAGVPFLLHDPVVLPSRAKVLSFCRFILIDPTRFRYLRSLEISAPGRFKPGPKADLLLAMLMHAKYLGQLRILDCEILTSDARIASAIAGLSSLRSLALHSLTDAACQILSALRADLIAVELGFWRDDAIGPLDPVPFLVNFTQSLQELRVTYAEFQGHTICYPAVRVLSIDDCRFAPIAPLITNFPHVSDLSIWTGQDDEDLEDTEMDEHRQMNIRSQQDAHWQPLAHLRGDIRSLYLLGPTCPVHHLDVQSGYMTSTRIEHLSTLLAVGRPHDLTLRARIARIDHPTLAMLLPPVQDTLVHVVLFVDCAEHTRDDVQERLEDLIRDFGTTSVETIILHLYMDAPEALENSEENNQDTHPLHHLNIQRIGAEPFLLARALRRLVIVPGQDSPICWEMRAETTTMRRLPVAEAT